MTVYADVPTVGLSKATAGRLATLLHYAATTGQQPGIANGQLPAGYLPLSKDNGLADLADYTGRAGQAVAAQRGDGAAAACAGRAAADVVLHPAGDALDARVAPVGAERSGRQRAGAERAGAERPGVDTTPDPSAAPSAAPSASPSLDRERHAGQRRHPQRRLLLAARLARPAARPGHRAAVRPGRLRAAVPDGPADRARRGPPRGSPRPAGTEAAMTATLDPAQRTVLRDEAVEPAEIAAAAAGPVGLVARGRPGPHRCRAAGRPGCSRSSTC